MATAISPSAKSITKVNIVPMVALTLARSPLPRNCAMMTWPAPETPMEKLVKIIMMLPAEETAEMPAVPMKRPITMVSTTV